MKRLPRLPGGKRERLPPIVKATTPEQTDQRSALEIRFAQALDDEKLARKLVKLQAKFPVATLPELVAYEWLQRRNIPFSFQVELFGGRRVRGGLLPDFVIEQGATALAWQIQGEYWHSVGLKDDADRTNNLRMLGQVVDGRRIEQVVELWENDIYQKRPQVFNMGLAGIGMRQ